MLKLNRAIKFTPREQEVISALMSLKKGDKLLTGSEIWEVNNKAEKALKHRISKRTLWEQNCRCAYCECMMVQGNCFIEHFVPKSLHREFVYEPENLTSSCGRCNCTGIKGHKETLNSTLSTVYNLNQFKIVHPYIDQPDQHIVFKDAERTVFDKARCSPKGLATIEFFHWDDDDAIFARQREVRTLGFPTTKRNYILKISTYRRK